MKFMALLAIPLVVTACAETRTAAPSTTTSSTVSRVPQAQAPQPSADVRDAQTRLRTLGMYDGSADGLWGPETQAAVQHFQRAQGLPVTAQLDSKTLNAIRSAESTPITLSNPTDVRTVQNRLRQLNFYNGPADGVWGQRTQVSLENFQRARGLPVGNLNRGTVSAMGLDASAFSTQPTTSSVAAAPRPGQGLEPGVIRNVQQRLRQQGYYSGPIDGIWGQGTQTSLANFQKSRGIEASGQMNPITASALGLDPNNLSASVPPAGR